MNYSPGSLLYPRTKVGDTQGFAWSLHCHCIRDFLSFVITRVRVSETASECRMCTLINLLETLYTERKHDICKETIETVIFLGYIKTWKFLIFLKPPECPKKIEGVTFENIYRGCNNKNVSLELLNEFLANKSNRNYKYLSFKQYTYHTCSLTKIIKENIFHSNSRL